ncbi:MAG: hypothetical protein AAFP90_03135 [Planctomycetota bacterium]
MGFAIAFSRSILLFAFALFWGGLTFYTGFVVRISHDVLADPMDGGLITRRVTSLLQIAAAVTAVLMLTNALLVARRTPRLGYSLAGLAVVLIVAVIGLFIVHANLNEIIDVDAAEITDRALFTILHRRYNQLTTLEWLATVVYLPTTLVAWRIIDRGEHPANGDAAPADSIR